jgi:hypothetical protein
MRGAARWALSKASGPPTGTPQMLMGSSSHRQTSSSSLLPAAARRPLDDRSLALDLGQVAVLALRRPAGHLTHNDGLDVVRNNAGNNDHLVVTDAGHHVCHHALRADLHQALLVGRHEALRARRIPHAGSRRCG